MWMLPSTNLRTHKPKKKSSAGKSEVGLGCVPSLIMFHIKGKIFHRGNSRRFTYQLVSAHPDWKFLRLTFNFHVWLIINRMVNLLVCWQLSRLLKSILLEIPRMLLWFYLSGHCVLCIYKTIFLFFDLFLPVFSWHNKWQPTYAPACRW